jgi:transposase
MNYVGIDIHKRYSVLVAVVDERGQELARGRISGNSPSGFAQFFSALCGPSKVVVEACWNWGRIHDVLSEIEQVKEVVLAHPLKTRLIAEAQIKTDSLDALALATLLRGNLIAPAHVPDRVTRARKEELRQRLYWARLRTRIRNRVHALIDRQSEVQMPQCSDLFGRKGLIALSKLILPEPDATLLGEDLELLKLVDRQIKAQEARIVEFNSNDKATLYLQSLPGMGKILAAVAAAEIDSIERFSSAAKLSAYAGLVPTTHASGGKAYQGHLLKSRNKWLQWAFIEAAWVAVGCSSYFGGIYRVHRARGKKANVAITIVARRMCRIAFTLLKERRNFQEHNFPGRSARRLTAAAA